MAEVFEFFKGVVVVVFYLKFYVVECLYKGGFDIMYFFSVQQVFIIELVVVLCFFCCFEGFFYCLGVVGFFGKKKMVQVVFVVVWLEVDDGFIIVDFFVFICVFENGFKDKGVLLVLLGMVSGCNVQKVDVVYVFVDNVLFLQFFQYFYKFFIFSKEVVICCENSNFCEE